MSAKKRLSSTSILCDLSRVSVAALLFSLFGTPAQSNPEDGTVNGGAATISSSGKNLDVYQTSDKVVIDWRKFDINADEKTEFHQPNSGSIALNRINSNDPSHIMGTLSANGNIIIVNPNGVLFGKDAKVDVNGLVASTADISNQNFMSGNMKFDKPGNPNASISNEGQITAKEAGLVGLVAPNVSNSGTITAKLGKVQLSSADEYTVDMYGDGLMEIKVSDDVKSQIVSNTGKIQADGGTIELTAAAGRNVVNSLINVQGELHATSISQHNGKIIISAEGSNKTTKTGSSTAIVNADIDASGNNDGETGGSVDVLADNVQVTGGTINASGNTGGGKVRIGGDFHGEGTTPTALTTSVADAVTIDASAQKTGKGGDVTVWADNQTNFSGHIKAKGGAISGDGGNVETSAHVLNADGTVDASATNGSSGTWLLDPYNVTISTNGGTDSNITGGGGNPDTFTPSATSILSVNSVQTALNAGTSVIVTTGGTGSPGADVGDITVSNAIAKTAGGDATLTLSAFRNIILNAGISSTTGKLGVKLIANNSNNSSGYINDAGAITTNGGDIIMGGSSGTVGGATVDPTAGTMFGAAATGFAVGNAGQAGGVLINGVTVNAGGGNILINGAGQTGAASAAGVTLSGATVKTSSGGTITITADGGNTGSGSGSRGLYLSNTSVLEIATGTMNLTGNGGSASGGSGYGVGLSSSNTNIIRATGAGAINILGTSTATGGTNNHGIYIGATSSSIASQGGNMDLRGYGATGNTATDNYGIYADGNISTNSTGTMNLVGVGGGITNSGNDYGIYVVGSASVSTAGGDLTATGTGGGAGTGTNNYGIYVNGGTSNIKTTGAGNLIITGIRGGGATASNYGLVVNVANGLQSSSSSGTGNITLETDLISLNAANNIDSAGNLTVKTHTPGTALNVGSNTGGLQFTDTMIGYLTWGAGKYLQFGDATNTGAMNINSALSYTKALQFLTKSGSDITLAGALNTTSDVTMDSGNNLILNQNLTKNGAGAGTSTFLLKAKNDITLAGGKAVQATTGAANITLDSDSDADGTNGGAIVIGDNVTVSNITSNGGNIVLSGGTNVTTGYAQGNSTNTAGVKVWRSTVDSGGGTLTVRGAGYTGTTANGNYGIYLGGAANSPTIKTTGAGAVTLVGLGGGNGASTTNYGVFIDNNGTVKSTATSGGGVNITGYGGDIGGSGASNSGIYVAQVGLVTSVDGNIVINGNTGIGGQAVTNTTGNTNHGIDNRGIIETTGNATVTLNGVGGGSGASNNNYGIWNEYNIIRSTATNGGSITLNGYGGDAGGSGASNYGIFVNGSGSDSQINSKDGNIIINGNMNIGGQTITNSTGINQYGAYVQGGTINSTGNATITVNGTGGGSTSASYQDYGVDLYLGSLNSVTGNIAVNGTGGSSVPTGSNENSGVTFQGSGLITSTGASAITVTGTAGGGTASYGIYAGQFATSSAIGGASATGDITLIGDSMSLYSGTTSVRTAGNIIVKPKTVGTQMSVGSATNGLQINDTMIGLFNWGGYLQFGDATNTAAMDVNSAVSYTKALKFLTKSGSDINVNGALTTTSDLTFDSGNNLNINQNVSKTGAAASAFLFKAKNDIVLAHNKTIGATTGAANITFDSDSDADGVNGGAIVLDPTASCCGANINSNGGSVILSGGTNVNTGYAQGNATNTAGVNIGYGGINSGGGTITIRGKGYGGTTSNNYGVYLNSTTIQTTGAGAISITGIGGGSGASTDNYGFWNRNSTVKSTAASGGGITITGYGGDNGGTGANNYAIHNNSGTITSLDGAIILNANYNVAGQAVTNSTGNTNYGFFNDNGTVTSTGNATITVNAIGGGSGASNANYGVAENAGSTFSSSATNGGGITINGYGGGIGEGVYLASSITSKDGNIIINGNTGLGGQAITSGDSNGIDITNNPGVTSTGNATITLTGIGGGGSTSNTANNGVFINNNGYLTSASGAINITGTGGSGSGNNTGVRLDITGKVASTGIAPITITGIAGPGAGSYGISDVNEYGTFTNTIGGASAAGDIHLITDKINLVGNTNIQTTGNIIINPYTVGTTVGVGSGTGTLSLTDTYIGYLNWGTNSYLQLGDSTNTAAEDVNTALSYTKALKFVTKAGSDITLNHDLSTTSNVTMDSGNNLNLNQNLSKTGASLSTFLLKAKNNITLASSKAISSTTGATNITIDSDSDADGVNGGSIVINGGVSSNGGNITMGGGSGAITAGSGYAQGNATQVNGIYVNNVAVDAGGGNIIMNGKASSSATADSNYGVYINGASAAVKTNGAGTATIYGTGGGAVNSGSDFGVYVNTGAVVSTVDGALIVNGTGGGAGNGNSNYGVRIDNYAPGTTIKTTGLGNLSITGQAGNANGAGAYDYGVGSLITNGIQTTGTGSLTVNGTGAGPGSAAGVYVAAVSGINAGANSIMSITGNGGTTNGSQNNGVYLASGSITGNGSAMTINGTGGNSGGSSNHGIIVTGASSGISNTGSGTLTLNGIGAGTAGSGSDDGVYVTGGGVVSTVDGLLTVNGTGGGVAGGSYGVQVDSTGSTIKTTGSGNLAVNGTYGAGANNYGIVLQIGNALQTTGTGNITAAMDKLYLANANNMNSASDLILKPYTAGTTVGVGAGAGTLSITDTYLGYLNWGATNKLYIGGTAVANATAGAMNIDSTFAFTKPVEFVTANGSDITLSANHALSTSATGNAITMLSGRDLTINSNIGDSATTGTSNIFLGANRGIIFAAGKGVSGSGTLINLTMDADTNADQDGYINLSNGSFLSNGGNIILGGGADPTTTAAYGDATQAEGIKMSGSTITAGAGNISIIGHGYNTGSSAYGVSLFNASNLTTSGSGTISVTGTGGSDGSGSSNIGIRGGDDGIYSANGDITLTGIGGGGTSSYGLQFQSGVSTIGNGSTAGNINLIGDTWAAASTHFGAQTSGNIIIKPYTSGTTVGVGAGAGTLSVTDAELALLNWGTTNKLYIGGTAVANATAGAMTIDNDNSLYAFTKPVEFVTANGNDITLTNSHDLKTSATGNAITFLSGRDLTINSNITDTATTGTSNIFLGANRAIAFASLKGVSGSGTTLNMTLNADTDADSDGYIILNGGSFLSNGGYIYMGGGANAQTTAAYGDAAQITGITMFNNATVNAGGGNIIINGHGYNTGNSAVGFYLGGSSVQTSGAGTINITGVGGNDAAGNNNEGIYQQTGTISGGTGAINLTGIAGSGSGGNLGVYINTTSTISSSGSSPITITGIGDSTLYGYGIQLVSGTNSVGGASATGDITLITDNLALGAGTNIQTTGNIIVKPYTSGTTVGIGNGAGTLFIADTYLGYLNWGAANKLYIGGTTVANATAGTMNIDNDNSLYAFTKPVEFVTANGNDITLTGDNLSTSATGNAITMLSGRDLNINRNIVDTATTGTSNIFLGANRSILFGYTRGVSGSGTAINLTLDADTNADQDGAIAIDAGTFNTAGGNIIMGGGAAPATTAAYGDASNPTGVVIGDGAIINAGGGNITINGNGAAITGNSNKGVAVDFATVQTSGAGTINITGTGGGTGASDANTGIGITSGTTISSANGAITLIGTGGAVGGNSNGVQFASTGTVSSTGGPITITGTAGAASYYGIYLNGGTNTIGGGSTNGDISLIANSLLLGTNSVIQTAGNIIVKPSTSGTTVGVGAGAGYLSLTDAYLGYFNWGAANKLYIGGTTVANATAGAMTINSGYAFTKPVEFVTQNGSDITLGGTNLSTSATGNAVTMLSGRDLILNKAITDSATTGTSNLFLSAYRDLYLGSVSGSGTIINVTADADADANQSGGVALNNNASVVTNGGNIIIGGGANAATTAAYGDSTIGSSGVYIQNATLDASATGGGGNISLTGHGYTTGNFDYGVQSAGTATIKTSGNGNITINGTGGGDSASAGSIGVAIGDTTITAQNGAINITGIGGAGVAADHGVYLTNSAASILSTGSGPITIIGHATDGNSGGSSDDIKIVGSTVGGNSASGDITVKANNLDLIGGTTNFQTTGNIIIEPYTSGTTVGVGAGAGTLSLTDTYLGYLNWGTGAHYLQIGDSTTTGAMDVNTAFTFPKAVKFLTNSSSDITVSGALASSATGNALTFLAGRDLLLNRSISDSAAGNITLQANRDIHLDAASVITQGGNIVLDSDHDETAGGAIALNWDFVTSSLTSNGGNITLGGGADPTTTAAIGDATYTNGINNNGYNINAGGGNISMRGTGYANASGSSGIYSQDGAISTTGAGNINIIGTGGGSGTNDSAAGIFFAAHSDTDTLSVQNGDINLTGTGGAGSGGSNSGLFFYDNVTTANINIISTGSGNINLTGIAGAGSSQDLGFNFAANNFGGASDTGNITFNINTWNADGTSDGFTTQTGGSGTVWFKPRSAATTIGVGGGAGALQITDGILDKLTAPNIKIGRTDGSGLITLSDYTNWRSNLILQNGSANISLGGDQTFTSNKNVTATTASGDIITNAAGTITTAGTGSINLTSGHDIIIGESDDFTTTGSGGITLRANNNITSDRFSDYTTQGGDVIFNSDRDATGGGGIFLGGLNDAYVTSNGGDIILGGGANPLTTAAIGNVNTGIALENYHLDAGGGDINIIGEGYGGGAFGMQGIAFSRALMTTTGSGNINITGTGGANPSYGNAGIDMEYSLVSAADGAINITGTARGDGSANPGMYIGSGTDIEATGTGSINITGYGSGNFDNGHGLQIGGAGTTVTTKTGALNITGTGTATSSYTDNYGISIVDNAVVASTSGPVTLTGIATNSQGLYFDTATIGGASETGNIHLVADRVNFTNPTIRTSGNIIVNPYTAGTQMSVGSATNGLQLTDAYLGYFNWGTGAHYLQLGDSTNTAAMDVNTANAFTKAVKFITKSGSNITLSGNLNTISDVTMDSGNNLILNQNISKTGAGTSNFLLKAKNDITLAGGKSITSTTGATNITLDSDADGINGGAIKLGDGSGTTTVNSNGGDIILSGGTNVNTGFAQGDAANIAGVDITNHTSVTSGAGSITVRGKGYAGVTGNHGVFLDNGQISTVSGIVNITGIGGAVDPTYGNSDNYGVYLNGANSQIASTGTGGGLGTITVTGTGANGNGNDYGVIVSGGGAISTVDAAVSVTGTGGSSNGGLNYGVYVTDANSVIKSTGAGNVTIAGNGSGGNQSNHGIVVANAGQIIGNTGSLSLTGVGLGACACSFYYDNSDGIYVTGTNSTIKSIGTGSVGAFTINGTGGNGFDNNYGIAIDSGGSISTVDAALSITGTGGTGIDGNHGIYLTDFGSKISSTGRGAITINAHGGGAGSNNYGMLMINNAKIESTASNGGDITINGFGGTGTGDNNNGFGLGVDQSQAYISTNNANLIINGTGGANATGSYNEGVIFGQTASVIESTGAGNITVHGTGGGTGGAFQSLGVEFYDGPTVRATGTGNVTITGQGGSGTGGSGDTHSGIIFDGGANPTVTTTSGAITLTGIAGTGSLYGIELDSTSGVNTIGDAGTHGDISLIADKVLIDNASIQTTGNVFLKPYTASTSIGVGGDTGTLNLNSSVLSSISAGTLNIGRSDGTGLMQVAGMDLSGANYNLSLLNGSGNIQLDGVVSGSPSTITMAANKSFTVSPTSGNITTSSSTGITTSGTGNITLSRPLILGGDMALFSSTSGTTTLGTINGAHNLTATTGTFNFGGAIGGTTALNNVFLRSANSMVAPAITASSITLRTTGAAADITGPTGALTATGASGITLISGRDIHLENTTLNSSASNAPISITSTGNTYLSSVNSGTGNFTVNAYDVFVERATDFGGLITYYTFDEGTGTTTVDSSGNGNNGTLGGAAGFSSTVAPTGGTNTNSLNLGGTGYDAYAINSNSINSTGQLTFSVWVKSSATTNHEQQIIQIGGNYNSWSIYVDGIDGGKPSLSLTGDYNSRITGTTNIDDNSWHLVTGTYDGTTAKLYVDGSLQASGARTLLTQNGTLNSRIGENNIGDDTFVGLIDDARIYNTALSASQVGGIYGNAQTAWNVGTTSINATHDVNFDLHNDSITAAAGKNVSIIAGNNISGATAGTINTSQNAGSGGNLTMTANGTGTLNSSNITINAGGAAALTAAGKMTLGNITANTITGVTTAGDIEIASGKTLSGSASGTAVTLASAQNFINNSGSATPISTPSGRWLIYSTNASSDTLNSMVSDFHRFSCTYGGSCPTLGTGNGFLYTNTPMLTITANGQSINYGDAAPTLSGYGYSVSGYLGSDSGNDSLSGSLTGSTNYSQGNNVGSYHIDYASGSLASTLGYGFTYANNSTGLTVNQRAITVAADSGQGKVYGSSDPTLTYSLTSGSLYGTDAFTGALSRAAGETVAGGPYAVAQGTLTAGGNYAVTFTPGATFAITPYGLTVTADAKTKVYGASDPSLTYTYGTLKNGDDSSIFSGALSRAAGENVGNYAISQNTLSAGSNYTINYTGANLGITAAALTVTADAKTKTYGASDPSLTYTYSGLVNGDSSSVFTGALNRAAGENVGNYAIAQNTLTAGSNYTISYTGANLGITAAALTVTADAKTKVYGAGDPSLTYTYSGLTNGDNSSVFSGSLNRAAGENVGNYAIAKNTLTAGSNYTITYVGDNLSITPASLTVTADAKTKVYGAADPSLTYTYSGLTNGDNSSVFTGVLDRAVGENVGNYAIGKNTLSAGSNYTISYTGANLGITPAALSVTADAKTKTYGDIDPTFTYTYSGLTNGDSASIFSGALDRAAGENVGNYAIGKNTLSAGSNYTISYTGANLGINPADLTITADDKTKTFHDPNPAFTVSYSGFTNGDNSSLISGLSVTSTADINSVAGSYAIVPSGASAGGNYTVHFVNGTLTVTGSGGSSGGGSPTTTPINIIPSTVAITSQSPLIIFPVNNPDIAVNTSRPVPTLDDSILANPDESNSKEDSLAPSASTDSTEDSKKSEKVEIISSLFEIDPALVKLIENKPL